MLRHLHFSLFMLKALCEVVEQPAVSVFLFSDKSTILDLFDMYFMIFDIVCHSFVKISR